MRYKYTFKQYIHDKIVKLLRCIKSNLVYPITFIGGPLGVLIMDIILYRNYNGTEDITKSVLLADMAWIGLCIIIGVVVNHIAEDFRYEKMLKESEFSEKED